MCGIAGFMGNGDKHVLEKMIYSIRYRGPDSQSCHYDDEIALAHARLSILDLRQEGNCPMFTPDYKLCITFNGEIYNYLDLKRKLEEKYSFRTKTDTEVLLYLYKEYGVGMLDKINGMFAFAIYDYEKKELLLAKDRMGKKPLYYTETENSFVFASEIKPMLIHSSVKKEVNIEAVNQYLTFDYVPTPNSIIKNIYKLEASHYLVVKNNKIIKKAPYWKNDFELNNEISFQDAVNKLDELINESTSSRLMSDVPLGVFLSGGLDSSTIAYYAQKNAKQKIKSFSIGFEDKSYNESDYANQVAIHLGTDHHSKILTSKQTLDLIDEIYSQLDEPFADPSMIPTYFLSKFARSHVKVALGGDGSDELIAGYSTFISDKFKEPLASLPSSFSETLLSVANTILPVDDRNISFDFKVKQYLRGFLSKRNHIHQLWLGGFLPSEKKLLFKAEDFNRLNDSSGLSIIDKHFSNTKGSWSEFNRITYYYYQTYLLDDILVKVDRASMLNSLEVRAPFLDRNVVEFMNSLPKKYKIDGFKSKIILKKLMDNKLPENIVYRPKKGFGIPLSDWIRVDLKQEIESVLLTEDHFFNIKYIQRLLDEHHTKKNNHRKLIWNLFILKKYLKSNNF